MRSVLISLAALFLAVSPSLAADNRKPNLIILLSDLMDRPAEVLSGLQHFRHRHHEVIVFHILDPDEVDFPYTDTATFVDMESGERLTTLSNSNTYKFYLSMPDFKTAKGRLADLRFIRPYFEELGHSISSGEPIPAEQALRDSVVEAHRAIFAGAAETPDRRSRSTRQRSRTCSLDGLEQALVLQKSAPWPPRDQ